MYKSDKWQGNRNRHYYEIWDRTYSLPKYGTKGVNELFSQFRACSEGLPGILGPGPCVAPWWPGAVPRCVGAAGPAGDVAGVEPARNKEYREVRSAWRSPSCEMRG